MTPEQARAIIKMPDANVAFCNRHLEPFRLHWPSGFGQCCLLVMKHCIEDDRISNQFSKCTDGKAELDEKKLNHLLEFNSPLCCFLGDDLMQKIIFESLGGLPN